MKQAPSRDRSEIERHCVGIIDRHPHRQAILEADLRLWVREVVAAHGEAATWHALRAGGFGGSEIGVLVRNHSGVRADHQASAHDIIEGKLLRRMPLEETGPMRRGHDNEPRHAQWFWSKYGAQRDQESFDRLSGGTGLRAWMRYSPDELALIPIEQPNPAMGGDRRARWLVDYKAPSVVDDSEEVKFQYACQLHQGALICAKLGIHLDGLMLSQFDWANWELKDDHVAYDPQLARMILQAGDHYWDFVLRGHVPDYVVRPRFEGEADLRKSWEECANQVARLKAMHKAIEELLEPQEEALRAHLETFRMAGTRCTVGDLSISAIAKVDVEAVRDALPDDQGEQILAALAKKGSSVSYDAKAMETQLRSMGLPMKQFAKTQLDESKVYDWAHNAKLDPDAFIKETIRFSPNEDLKQRARDSVRQAFVPVVETPKAAAQSANDDHGPQDDRDGPDTTGRSAPRSVSA
jgi:hypothetical protein